MGESLYQKNGPKDLPCKASFHILYVASKPSFISIWHRIFHSQMSKVSHGKSVGGLISYTHIHIYIYIFRTYILYIIYFYTFFKIYTFYYILIIDSYLLFFILYIYYIHLNNKLIFCVTSYFFNDFWVVMFFQAIQVKS